MTTIIHYQIITTPTHVFEAWEPFAGHSCFTFQNGEKLGRIGSRPLPADLESLPHFPFVGWETRSRRVRKWLDAQYDEAHKAIQESGMLSGYTETSRSMGSILATQDAQA